MSILPLLSKGVVLFDGGFGSQVAARGLSFDCPERLNITNPEDVRQVHRSYVEAGAAVVETNTLGANPLKLRAHGLEGDAACITTLAVGHARASGAKMVACSMGTTAMFLAPFGPLTFEKAVENFAVQAKAAASAGADLIFTETLTDLAEARAMWCAAKAAGLPFAASFTFLSNGHTLTGSTPEVCAAVAEAFGAIMVGVNCVGDGALLLSIVRAMRAACRIPIVAQPNAGLPETVDGHLVYSVSSETLKATMAEAIALGAGAIGGCCGTTPSHIRAMAALLPHAPAPLPDAPPARVCSLRACLPLSEALAQIETQTLDALDVSDAKAVLLDIRGQSPEAVGEAMLEALTLLKQPLLFRADSQETLDAALLMYPGIAGVDSPFSQATSACWFERF